MPVSAHTDAGDIFFASYQHILVLVTTRQLQLAKSPWVHDLSLWLVNMTSSG